MVKSTAIVFVPQSAGRGHAAAVLDGSVVPRGVRRVGPGAAGLRRARLGAGGRRVGCQGRQLLCVRPARRARGVQHARLPAPRARALR